MSEMQDGDANTVLVPRNPYLVCKMQSSKPRVNYKICELSCKGYNECPYYNKWYEENFDRPLENYKKDTKRFSRRRKSTKKKGGK